MTGAKTQVVLLIDALGWELAERTGFLADRLPFRRRLRTILGYSSAAIPSLLTGVVPRVHGHWFLYFKARERKDSPFRGAGLMARMPRPIRERWTIRRRLGSWWSRSAGIEGYFGLYEVPYSELKDLDYVERKDTWRTGTFPGGSYIDDLAGRRVPVYVSDWRVPDDEKFRRALAAAESPDPPRVHFLYLTEIDARQHAHGSYGRPVDERLESYRQEIDRLLGVIGKKGPFSLTVCSDHGMTDVTRVVDPGPDIARTGLRSPRDFRIFIDSTFLRFWTGSRETRRRLEAGLQSIDWGRVLSKDEIVREGVDFEDDRYGSLLVLADPGVLLCPSYMGRSPLKGMHGYTPDDGASDAVLLRDVPDSESPPSSILDLRKLFGAELSGIVSR